MADVANALETVTFEEGKSIITKGVKSKFPLFFIHKGTTSLSNEEGLIGSYTSNDVIGEMLILNSDLSSTTITAQTACTLYAIPYEKLYQLMYSYTEVIQAIIDLVDSRIVTKSSLVK